MNNTINPLLDQLSAQTRQAEQAQTENSDELGKDVFLELLVTQMTNQNPLEPQANSEFVAQLAQFSSVEGLDNLNDTVSDMAASFQSSQALQATSLVGRTVNVQTSQAILPDEGGVTGQVNVPALATSLDMVIKDINGNVVRTQATVNQDSPGQPLPPGLAPFTWDGKNNAGERMPPGQYTIEFTGKNEDVSLRLDTIMNANVDSVTVGKSGEVTLNVAGVGPVALSKLQEIL